MEISTTKSAAMKGNELLWAKILIDNQISEEVEVYKYL
jgi:hypothetical protein